MSWRALKETKKKERMILGGKSKGREYHRERGRKKRDIVREGGKREIARERGRKREK